MREEEDDYMGKREGKEERKGDLLKSEQGHPSPPPYY